jgi:hypothetical protein
METTINKIKEFDAVLFMREIRTILNDLIIKMSFIEQKEFFNRLLTDKEFANQMIEKYKMQLTYNMR